MHSLCLALVLACTAGLAHAASFDCKIAGSPREKAVCADTKLSAQDSAVAQAFRRLSTKLSPASAALLRQDQRAWLAFLDRTCVPTVRQEDTTVADCLADGYSARKQDLTTVESLPSGHLLFTRGIYIAAPRKPGDDANCPHNPGFGTGSFAYPQIDDPTPAEAAFNRDVASAALSEFAQDGQAPSSFRSATGDAGETTLSYAIASANARFLSLVWSFGHEPYCAAHPLFDEGSFSFWMDKGRPLRIGDVFNADPSTSPKVTGLVSAKLHADKDLAFYLLDKQEAKGIPQALGETSQWLLSPDRVDLRFHRYQVAAYVAGTPTVRLRWPEIQPLLNPDLHPATLPKLRKAALDE